VQRRRRPNQILSNSQTTYSLVTWKIPGSRSLVVRAVHTLNPPAIVHNEPTQKIPAQTYGGPRATRVSQRFRMFRAKLLQKHQRPNPPRESPMTYGADPKGRRVQRCNITCCISISVCARRKGQHPRSCSVAPAEEVPVPLPGSRSKVMTSDAWGQNATRTWSSSYVLRTK
jgi:hypothetical protein